MLQLWFHTWLEGIKLIKIFGNELRKARNLRLLKINSNWAVRSWFNISKKSCLFYVLKTFLNINYFKKQSSSQFHESKKNSRSIQVMTRLNSGRLREQWENLLEIVKEMEREISQEQQHRGPFRTGLATTCLICRVLPR